MSTPKNTGLRDKNGKEIYEGDTIQYHRRGGIIADTKVYTSTIRYGKHLNQEYLYFDEGFPINSWNYLYDTFEVIPQN